MLQNRQVSGSGKIELEKLVEGEELLHSGVGSERNSWDMSIAVAPASTFFKALTMTETSCSWVSRCGGDDGAGAVTMAVASRFDLWYVLCILKSGNLVVIINSDGTLF